MCRVADPVRRTGRQPGGHRQVNSEGTDDPSGTPPYGSEPSYASSGDTGEHPVTWLSQGSGLEAGPFSPAGTARRELMMTQTAEGTHWSKRAMWFILAAFVGAMLAVILSSVH
jgi:hypothetical protein